MPRAAAAGGSCSTVVKSVYGIKPDSARLKDKIISREEVELLQRNIIVSHAVGVGKAV